MSRRLLVTTHIALTPGPSPCGRGENNNGNTDRRDAYRTVFSWFDTVQSHNVSSYYCCSPKVSLKGTGRLMRVLTSSLGQRQNQALLGNFA